MKKNLLFIDAVCKSREKFLLGKDKYVRLIDCENYYEAIKLLREFGFGKQLESDNLSELIKAEERELIEFIKEYSPGGGVDSYFLLPYDFLNAEALLKCKKLGLEKEKYLTCEASLQIENLQNAVNGQSSGIKELDEAIKTADQTFDSLTGAMLDSILLNAMYKAMLRLIKDSGLKKFVQTEIDLKNISILLRTDSLDEYKLLKLNPTSLTLSQEQVLFSKDKAKILQAFKGNKLYDFILKAVDSIGKPLTEFENLSQSFMLTALKERRFLIKGKEPYLLYVLYRKADILNVRLILLNLRAKESANTIKQKLRDSY